MSAFMKNINVIARCSEQYRTVRLAPLGLKSAHYIYILHICKEPGISQEGLARRIYVNKSSVTRKLAQLCEAGFVRKEISAEDRRIIRVYPTQKAVEAYPKVRQIIRDWNAYLSREMTEEEVLHLMALLEKIKQSAVAWMECEAEREGMYSERN